MSEEWNPKGYEVKAADKCRYKKLENISGNKSMQKVLCSTDKKQALLKFAKLPKGVDQSNPEQMKKVYGEVRILLAHPHPNFIRVRDAFIMDKKEIGTTYEWVEGDLTLDAWMKEKNRYQPPEIMLEGGYTRASDIWGLGLLLHEMATQGTMPFETTDQSQMQKDVDAKKHIDGKGFSSEFD